MIDRMPRKGEKLLYKFDDIFPKCKGTIFTVMGKFRNHTDILNIKEDGKDDHTQIIVKFAEGFNPYLHFIK